MSEALAKLIERKRHTFADDGFEPVFMPDQAFDFQQALIGWNCRKGRAATLADCGLGKSLIELTLAQNVVQRTNRHFLIVTPLAVSAQMIREAAKFGIDAHRSIDGTVPQLATVVVTNYERLHHFNPLDFAGVACDESSILKNCDGATRALVTDFVRKISYRYLCTATPAPNDLIELGTSSECLGYMGFNDMLSTFFKKDEKKKTHSRKDEYRSGGWRFRGHAEKHFFRWVCSWARAVRKPSDLGFSDERYKLPEMEFRETSVIPEFPPDGFLFTLPAVGLQEQRSERRRTLGLRCEAAAERCNAIDGASVSWCYLNDEGDELTRLINGAVQVSGSDSMERKEEVFEGFASGRIKKLVTKPDIAGFGLNWQHCAHQTFFPSHSFEQLYQCARRSWRFGQLQKVVIDMITSEGEHGVVENLKRKAHNAEVIFQNLVTLMGDENKLITETSHNQKTNLPKWLQ